MTTQTLLQIVAALAIAHLIHALVELGNVGAKLRRLASAVAGKDLPTYPVNIDTRLKAYTIGLIAPAVFFLIVYFVISVLGTTVESAAWLSVIALLVIEVVNVVGYDRYHIGIEKLIKKFSK